MPHSEPLHTSQLPSELDGFLFAPVRFENDLPVFHGPAARKELTRRFGLPNAVPQPGESPFKASRVLFVDDDHEGKPIAYVERL